MTAHHTLMVVVNETDDPQQMAGLRALHSLPSGVVVCDPAPLRSSLQWLAADLLDALGKRDDFTGTGRNAEKGWARSVMWLIAERVTDLVILRAGALAPAQWVQLCQIAAICQTRLWMVVLGRPMTSAQTRVTQDWPFRHAGYAQLAKIGRRKAGTRASTAATAAPLPDVPSVDFTVFRAVARKVLSASDFARVDALFGHTVRRLTRELNRRAIDLSDAAAICCREVEEAQGISDALTRLRATQRVLVDRDILVRVRVPQLIANAPQRPLDERGADTLRGYAAPEYACLGALVLAYGLNPYTLANVPVSAISDKGELAGRTPSTPVASLMLAHRLQRAWDGAADTDPLLCRGYANRPTLEANMPPASGASLHRRFRAVGRDTGLFTPGRWMRRVEASPVLQAASYGITVHSLTDNPAK